MWKMESVEKDRKSKKNLQEKEIKGERLKEGHVLNLEFGEAVRYLNLAFGEALQYINRIRP